MKTASHKRGTKEMYDCCCHMRGRKPIFLGLMLVVIGWALTKGYGFAEVLMLIGGILVVKGLLVIAAEAKK